MIKTCLFDELFIEGLQRHIHKEIVLPIRQKGYHLAHRSTQALQKWHERYDALLIHTRSIDSGLIRVIQIDLQRPILMIAGTDSRFDGFRNLIALYGPTPNLTYSSTFLPDEIIKFIESVKAKTAKS